MSQSAEPTKGPDNEPSTVLDVTPALATPAKPERHPLIELLTIAGPTVATMTSYTLMQFVDKLIVSRIGPEPIYVGAQGDGGIAAFVPISIVIGILQVVNTYVSQNMGAGKPDRAPAYAWNAIWIAIVCWALLIPYGFMLPQIFTAMGREPERAALAASYGQILVFGAGLTLMTRAVSQFFYGMHRPGVVLLAGVVANLINLGLAYLLVYGELGFPKMGIPGSGIATVIATGVELCIPMTLFLSARYNKLYKTRSAWRPSLLHVKDLVRIGWPGGVMFGNEMICWSYFMVFLVGHFGEEHSMAGWIAHQWMTLSFMPAVGISVAVTAMVGKCIGMGRPDLARQRAFMGLGLALAYMGTCAITFVVFRHQMIAMFIDKGTTPEVTANVIALGTQMMVAAAAFQLFDAVAMTLSGALRGAGDTIVPGLVTVVLAWLCIVVGGNLFVRFAPSLQSVGPWIAAAIYILALCVFFLSRFLMGKWQTMSLVKKA
ncbi:MAG: MATE family efflux transporter [Pyrinomonadaceae bacterium]|nr:MATE family efflux transporter [Phycisphaerales bacterium]